MHKTMKTDKASGEVRRDAAYLDRTLFHDERGFKTWGWRMGDDFTRSFVDCYEEADVPIDPLDLLAVAAMESHGEGDTFLESLLSEGRGISINGTWHKAAAIAPVLKMALGLGDRATTIHEGRNP